MRLLMYSQAHTHTPTKIHVRSYKRIHTRTKHTYLAKFALQNLTAPYLGIEVLRDEQGVFGNVRSLHWPAAGATCCSDKKRTKSGRKTDKTDGE